MAAHRLVRFVSRVGWVACLGSMALALAAPGVARLPAVQWSPWVVGLFLLGVPHGAFDHRVCGELEAIEAGGPARAAGPGFYAAYLGAAAAVLGLWFASPVAASVGFLAVAAAHFGQGDVAWGRQSAPDGGSGPAGYRASLLVARSALPIALPLLAFPGELSGAADVLAARLFGGSGWSIPPRAIVAGRLALAAAVVLQVGWALRLARAGGGATGRARLVDVAETTLLAGMFSVVPPVLALGVYFNAWHSLRHVARLLAIAGPTRSLVDSGRLFAAFVAFQAGALPMTCGALALVVGLGLVVGRSLVGVEDLGLVALVALSALTLPHVLVVAWMDLRQGVWSARPGRGR